MGESESEMGELYRDLKERRRLLRQRLGVPCEGCKKRFPKANPTILLPRQKCFCGHRDARKRHA